MGLPVVLSIAGSDPSGGAGLQADLKTFTALKVYGCGVPTAITVQNTTGVREVHPFDPELVYSQIRAVLEDISVNAVKVGMLANEGIVRAVAKAFREFAPPNVVVDTVLLSKNRVELLEKEAVEILKRELFPLSFLITPNIPEAEFLTGKEIKNLRDMENCGKYLLELGPKAVLIKGGHLKGDKAIDLLITDSEEVHYFVKDKLTTENTRGTGCTLSSAIASFLAKGFPLEEAVFFAKEFLFKAMERGFKVGKGLGSPDHTWTVEDYFGKDTQI